MTHQFIPTAGGAAPEALVLDLVEWVARKPRRYTDVLDAWRTSCPRLPVLEDALDRGLIVRGRYLGNRTLVLVSAAGRDFLRRNGRRPYRH